MENHQHIMKIHQHIMTNHQPMMNNHQDIEYGLSKNIGPSFFGGKKPLRGDPRRLLAFKNHKIAKFHKYIK